MKLLGIDYGRNKIGLAVSESMVAQPLKVIRSNSAVKGLGMVEAFYKKISEESPVDKIVIGISEGKMAEETREFGNKLKEKLGVPVVFQDETLSSATARELSMVAGIKRSKRKRMEDAYSAAIILQSYLDGH